MQLDSRHFITPHTWCSPSALRLIYIYINAEPSCLRGAIWCQITYAFHGNDNFSLPGTNRSWQLYQHKKPLGTTKSVSSDRRYHPEEIDSVHAILMIFVRNNRSRFRCLSNADAIKATRVWRAWCLIRLMRLLNVQNIETLCYLTWPGLASSQIEVS